MGLFYTASTNEMVQRRKKIFLDHGLPALYKNGFEKSPFAGIWFGYYPNVGYIYELCRLGKDSNLEKIEAQIVRGDRWIQVYLNIFKLVPEITSLSQLQGVDGMQFGLPPNSISNMRLPFSNSKRQPIAEVTRHKIRSYHTKSGFEKRVQQLGERLTEDLNNIDVFIKRWHELHKPLVTDWQGKQVEHK